MKLKISLLFLLLSSGMFAHRQHAHQLIALEAYKLIQLHFGFDIPALQNPFSTNTNICYEIKEEGTVTIEIYNLVGERIITLVKEFQKPGDYIRQLDMRNFTPGTYFCDLRINGFHATQKILVIK